MVMTVLGLKPRSAPNKFKDTKTGRGPMRKPYTRKGKREEPRIKLSNKATQEGDNNDNGGDDQALLMKKKKKTVLVRIRVSDPYATESSSDEEEEEEKGGNKKKDVEVIRLAEIPYDVFTSCSSLLRNHKNKKQDQYSSHGNEQKKNIGADGSWPLILSSSTTSLIDADNQDQDHGCVNTNNEWLAMGLPDVPGPIPDNLESFMLDSSLLDNFFEGLPSYDDDGGGGDQDQDQDQGQQGLSMSSIDNAWQPAVGLPHVPGPIPDNLDNLMLDSSLMLNFFEGLPIN